MAQFPKKGTSGVSTSSLRPTSMPRKRGGTDAKTMTTKRSASVPTSKRPAQFGGKQSKSAGITKNYGFGIGPKGKGFVGDYTDSGNFDKRS